MDAGESEDEIEVDRANRIEAGLRLTQARLTSFAPPIDHIS